MNTKEWDKRVILFIVGFVVYIGIEVIWGAMNGALKNFEDKTFFSLCGFSSVWMGLLGGVIFLLLGKINEFKYIRDKFPLALQCLLGALVITLLEFIAGIILNVWLKFDIWDYEGLPLAHLFLNQINLFHSILWFFLSTLAFWLDDALRWVMYKLGKVQSCNKIYNFFWLFIHLFSPKPPKFERLQR